jgi:NAD(P)H-hydrate epimerase
VHAHHTVTFNAPKPGHVLAPACNSGGELRVAPIGIPPALYEGDGSIWLSLVQPAEFRHLLGARPEDANKGIFGHVLVVAGSRGKTGAAAMAGMAALRAGAGLVTVASAESAIPVIASHAAELMTEPLPETGTGGLAWRALEGGRLNRVIERKDLLAIGPGMGTDDETVRLVRKLFAESPKPMVIDADGLNALAGTAWSGAGRRRVLTPHPGEMSRLCGMPTAGIAEDRVGVARQFATDRQVTLVLKGQRTLIAFPDGRVWINPTGSPAMATGGTGDILTGLIAGFLGQFPGEPELAIAAAVYLHGLAGQLGAAAMGEKSLIATDLLRFLPKAMEECGGFSRRV